MAKTLTTDSKISDALRTRLDRLGKRDRITVLVLGASALSESQRLDPGERQRRIKGGRATSDKLRAIVRNILPDTGDSVLPDQDIDLFGGIVVTATRQDVELLAERDDVEAILENQGVEIGRRTAPPRGKTRVRTTR
ncbi:hypothetical protein HQ560_06180 [bacterium]|nr:hypothetical protein [bacterium]